MRKLIRNGDITIKALKRHPELILGETGRNYQIIHDQYTDAVPFAQWLYWVLRKKSSKYLVMRVCRPKEQRK